MAEAPCRHSMVAPLPLFGYAEMSRSGGVSAWQAHLTSLGCEACCVIRWVLRHPCFPDPKVLPGARRVLGFSPLIVDRHVSRFLLAFLTDDLGSL